MLLLSDLQYGTGQFGGIPAGGYFAQYHCGHNLLLAHGRTVQLYRSKYQPQQVRTPLQLSAMLITIAKQHATTLCTCGQRGLLVSGPPGPRMAQGRAVPVCSCNLFNCNMCACQCSLQQPVMHQHYTCTWQLLQPLGSACQMLTCSCPLWKQL